MVHKEVTVQVGKLQHGLRKQVVKVLGAELFPEVNSEEVCPAIPTITRSGEVKEFPFLHK